MIVEMRSLGRGRGFEVVNEASAFLNEVLMSRISKRLDHLLEVIEGKRVDPLDAENSRLRDEVEELEDDVRALEDELERARIRLREFEDSTESEANDELLLQINEVLEGKNGEEFDDLPSAVEALIADYCDALEELDDES